MRSFFSLRRETAGRLLVCVSRGLLACLLAGAQLLGGYAPFAVGAVGAAGPGWTGLAALVGAGLGALRRSDFPHALRTMACSVLLFTANNAFCELKAYQKRWFLPAMTAGLMLTVEAIYVVRAGSLAELACCLTATAIAALFASCCRQALESSDARRAHPGAALMLLVGILTALGAPEFTNGVAPGRAAATLAVLFLAFDRDVASALTSALCIGLAADLAAQGSQFLHTACYGFAALATRYLHRESRVRAAGVFALAAALFALPLGVETGAPLLYEALLGTLLFLLLPSRLLRAAHEPEPVPAASDGQGLRRRLRESADTLRELYESAVSVPPPEEENPAVIFDRAAEAVCRDCPQRDLCWEREYGRTYNALNDAASALLQKGAARSEDFQSFFVERCARFSSFLTAVNAETHAFLLRRQFRRRLEDARVRSAGHYAQLSALLRTAADAPDAAPAGAVSAPLYRVGSSLRPRAGESVSGDSAAAFETETGTLCLLLCDGMGSGEEARRESAFAARQLERLLRAGIDPDNALKTIHGALRLRGELSDSFVTLDLMTLCLQSGEGALYKYGAAPTYVKRDARVYRVGCSCLPAGLAGDDAPPETTRIRLEPGSCLVMVTDGVADPADDAWLQSLLAEWEGESPQMLASSILADSSVHKGAEDDAGVLALCLPESASGNATREV